MLGLKLARMGLILHAGLALAALATILHRLFVLNPMVMQDELVFRLSVLNPADLVFNYGNYFAALLFPIGEACGQGFYGCIKGLNLVFALTSIAIIFWMLLTSGALKRTAAPLVFLSTSPLVFYSSLYTPDAVYLFASLVALVVSGLLVREYRSTFLAIGVVFLGIALLSKPHALPLAALLPIAVWVSLRGSGLGKRLGLSAAALMAPVLIRLFVAVTIFGPRALNLLGEEYSKNLRDLLERASLALSPVLVAMGPDNFLASQSTVSTTDIFLAQLALYSTALILLTAPALALHALSDKSDGSSKVSVGRALLLFSIATLVVYGALISVFGTLLTVSGDDHGGRFLGRYFEFALVAAYLSTLGLTFKRPSRSGQVSAVVFLGLGIMGFLALRGGLNIQPFDSILLSSIFGNQFGPILYLVAVFCLLAIALVPRGLNLGKHLAMPLIVAILAFSANQTLISGGREHLTEGEVTALALQGQVTDGPPLVIVSQDPTSGQLAAFWLAKNHPSLVSEPGRVSYASESLRGLGSNVILLDGVLVQGQFSESVFRTTPSLLDLDTTEISPLDVSDGQMAELSGISATSSQGNWFSANGSRLTWKAPWLENQTLILTLGAKPSASFSELKLDVCGTDVTLPVNRSGVLEQISIVAPTGTNCSSIVFRKSGGSDSEIVLSEAFIVSG